MAADLWDKSYTPVRFPRADFSLEPDDPVIFWGSCFAEELLGRYERYGLPGISSPFGLIYNPASMLDSLNMMLTREMTSEPFYFQEMWRHYAFHSSRCFRGKQSDEVTAENHFLSLLQKGARDMERSKFLIITLGTAWVYILEEIDLIVNNCHRRDNRLFRRELYTRIGGDSFSLLQGLDNWKVKNDNLRVILTVSPVRHLRDDARGNSLSKAVLRCLCEELSGSREWISYFPSYEIMMDELRDYRWYREDLCHPSDKAVDYIISRFFDWCGSENLRKTVAREGKAFLRSQHRSRD
jgi:hypothetical protein